MGYYHFVNRKCWCTCSNKWHCPKTSLLKECVTLWRMNWESSRCQKNENLPTSLKRKIHLACALAEEKWKNNMRNGFAGWNSDSGWIVIKLSKIRRFVCCAFTYHYEIQLYQSLTDFPQKNAQIKKINRSWICCEVFFFSV